MAEVDFRVKNGLVVGANATITGTITASTFVGDGSGITGVTTTATASYDSLTGTVPTWNQNTTGTAAGLSSTLAVASGGTGVTSSTGTGSVVLSASPTFTGTVSGITATMVGLGNLTNNAAVANLSGTNTGDQILPTTLPASDVYAWAKEATKPTYTASEVGLGNVDNTTDLLKPISTATQTALDLKSPLASPTFTGTPSVPTATVGTNTTQIASTAYVRAEVSALVASAPTALDTLNELATALGNDANFSTTVTTALGLKAPLASPTFTGTTTVTNLTYTGTVTGTGALGTTGVALIGNQAITGSTGTIRLITSAGINYIQSGLNVTAGSAAPLVFGSIFAGNEWVRITNTGNVGIGTSSPAGARLRVNQPSGVYGASTPLQSWAYANVQVINLQNDGALNPVWNTDPDSTWSPTATMIWQYRGSEKMRIDSSGNVVLKTGSLQEVKTALAALDVDISLGNYFTKTITAISTLTVSNVPATGTVASFILDLTNGGAFAITWWANMKWASGTAPTLTASGRDILGFFTHDAGTTWNGLVLAKDIK
jgi:hypothetical protein